MSFVAFERSSEGIPDGPVFVRGGEAQAKHRSGGELTREVERKTDGFQGVKAPRHQVHCRLEVFVEAPHHDLVEVETVREVAQLACDRADPAHAPQVEGPSKFGRGRRNIPPISVAPPVT